MSTVSVRSVVSVTPGVLAATGAAVAITALMLTRSAKSPIGALPSFPTAAAVGAYFGQTSTEKLAADVYFAGFDNSNVKPGALGFAQYPAGNVGAYLRGGNISTLTLTQLQAITGSLTVVIDGVSKSGSPSLSGATSFSSAGAIIAAALGILGPQSSAFTAAISGTIMTVSASASGAIAVGDTVAGSGVTAGTTVTALGTGTGGVGTYTVSASQTVASGSLTTTSPAVQYDSVQGAMVVLSPTTGAASTVTFATGGISAALALTSATGAVTSQGAVAATPAAFMSAVVLQNLSWRTFMCLFDPDGGSGNAQKYAFAVWNGQQTERYCYVCQDTDGSPAASPSASSSLGRLLEAASVSGTALVWEPTNLRHAAFVCGMMASVDFQQLNGRTNFKFRSQSGLVASVTDDATAANLAANGYNFYGAYGPATPPFLFFANGVVSGRFKWLDTYANQLWLNAAFTNALIALLVQARSIPYNAAGRAMIEAALADPINAGLRFGAYVPGVTLSAAQTAQVNSDSGRDIARTLSSRGWYLLVGDAQPSVRQSRGSPPCTFWYMDGQSVNQINLASIVLQ